MSPEQMRQQSPEQMRAQSLLNNKRIAAFQNRIGSQPSTIPEINRAPQPSKKGSARRKRAMKK